MHDDELPADFLARIRRLAPVYLETSDPRLQSGFGGGPHRWRAEREPILDAMSTSGSLLDVGCANGHLVECLRAWGADRGLTIDPFGVDLSAALIEVAMQRLPEFRTNFFVGNAWSWTPPQRFTYVYTLADLVPRTHLGSYLARLRREFLVSGGRLIVGSYGSLSRRIAPLDLEHLLPSLGIPIAGSASGGAGDIARFSWSEGLRS
jgi:SAM-dependent methyltransferase